VAGETAADVNLPNAIIVPSYVGHPDAIWTYGAYDDHFDGSTLNAKWTQTTATGGTIGVSGSMVHLLGNGTPSAKIAQNVPAGVSFTITCKMRMYGYCNLSASANVNAYFQLYNSTSSGMAVQHQLAYSAAFASNANTTRQILLYGANFSSITDGLRFGDLAPYWQFRLNWTDKSCGIYASFDGLTWVVFGVLSGAQSGFASFPPTTFALMAICGVSGAVLVSIDWFKLTTP
jgi:hypothetical protein